jgi:hypothetical protein
MKKSEDPKKFFDLLEKSIIEVVGDNITIKNDNLKLKEYKNKYSNLTYPVMTLFNDDIALNSNFFKVKYRCLCGSNSTIRLKKFLNKGTLVCSKCRETEEKRKRHSELLMSPNFKKKIKPIKRNDIEYLIDKSLNEFELESPEFVENYYSKNITYSEFNILKPKIIKINGVDVTDINYRFIPTLSVGNQSKYSQYVIVGDKKILFGNLQFKCDNCGSVFNTTRRPKEKIKNHKIMCQSCSLCNNTFKVKKYKTKFGDNITFQSNLEKDFIMKCESLGIIILDGVVINYNINGKNHKYRVDFLLPNHNLLIEIKGNHIWHRNQLNSGVWKMKQDAAEKYSQLNGLTYKLLFQEDLEDFFTSIKI